MKEKMVEPTQEDSIQAESAEPVQSSERVPSAERTPPLATESGVKKAVQKTKEVLNTLPSIPSARGAVEGSLVAARESLVGSLSMTKELEHLGSDYVDFYKKAIVTPPKALWDLVRLHPIKAVQDAVDGTKDIIKDMGHIATSPIRLAAAGASNVGGALKKAATLPFATAEFVAKSPFKLWRTIENGINGVFQMADQANQWAEQKTNQIMHG